LSLAAGRVGVLENLDRFGIVSHRFKWMEGVAAVLIAVVIGGDVQ
jgi:hypothetical protein